MLKTRLADWLVIELKLYNLEIFRNLASFHELLLEPLLLSIISF